MTGTREKSTRTKRQQIKKRKRSTVADAKHLKPRTTAPSSDGKPRKKRQRAQERRPEPATRDSVDNSHQVELEPEEVAAPVPPSESYRKIHKAERERWKTLGNKKEFVAETFRLKYQLELSFQDNPDQVREFFRPKFFVDAVRFPAANQKINGVRDRELKARLKRYAEYALRYGVIFGLSEKEPHFRVQGAGIPQNVTSFGAFVPQ